MTVVFCSFFYGENELSNSRSKGELHIAAIRDCIEAGTRVEFTIKKRIPGELEGSQLHFKYFRKHQLKYELDRLGWTNMTIRNYIEVTSGFPLEILNGLRLNQMYASFERDLYQLSWQETPSEGVYVLNFYGAKQDFSIHATADEIRSFGQDLQLECEEAPLA